MTGPLFLGIDLGTSSLKCGLFDEAGSCLRAESVFYPTREWEGGAEQHCGDWWSALVAAVRRAATGIDPALVVAIGIGGHAPSPVFVDADLEPVCPVLPWFDSRTKPQHDRLLEILGGRSENGDERLMGQVAARAMWLRSADPSAFARTACILHSGDYLVARLTGQRVLTSSRAPNVFSAADLPLCLIPPRECRTGETVGRIAPEVARELQLGSVTSVVSCGLDSFLGSVGSGVQRPGDACLNTGSSAVVSLLTEADCAGRFKFAGCQLLSRPISPGGRAVWRFMQTAGLVDAPGDVLKKAADIPPSASILRHLPDLVQRTPLDESSLHATLSALRQRRSPVEAVRLLLDTILLRERLVLEEFERACEPARRVRLAGGLVRFDVFTQLQCDILGRTVEIPKIPDSGTLGAAVMAAASVAQCPPEEAAARMVRIERAVCPRASVADVYTTIFDEIRADAGLVNAPALQS
jgi:xylulokinase